MSLSQDDDDYVTVSDVRMMMTMSVRCQDDDDYVSVSDVRMMMTMECRR